MPKDFLSIFYLKIRVLEIPARFDSTIRCELNRSDLEWIQQTGGDLMAADIALIYADE